MKKSVSKGGALPKFRFTLAVFALAASCGANPRNPVEVEIKAQPITIPNLNARALTIDTNGYVGDICIGTFGCYLDGTIARPFELPPGVHDIFSNYCHHPTNGQDHRLGTITVDAAGRGTVDTNHFDPVNETTIRHVRPHRPPQRPQIPRASLTNLIPPEAAVPLGERLTANPHQPWACWLPAWGRLGS